MKVENLNESCTGCGACRTICPKQCISMVHDEEGFYFPKIDKNICIECGKCDDICPVLNLIKPVIDKKTYYGWSKKEIVRKNSSSGGIFAELANFTLNNSGIVFGAIFDPKSKSVVHSNTESHSLDRIQKSKYVESNLLNTQKRIIEELDKKRTVLFCGTPCQVDGLKRVVKRNLEYLITCDFICHGVPSCKFFNEHLKHIENKLNDKVIDVNFRSKKYGWTGPNFRMNINLRKKNYSMPYRYDTYFKGFMTENIFLRKCCYECKYVESHMSDITLADFWGYKNFKPNLNDEKGISLIVTNNEIGNDLITKLKNELELHDLDYKYAEYVFKRKDLTLQYANRKSFFELAERIGFEAAARDTYMKKNEPYIIFLLKKMIRKILLRNK
jgi:coenzyme F420-reducing hydrogenase beta subunit